MVAKAFENIQNKASNDNQQIHDLYQWMICVTDVIKSFSDQIQQKSGCKLSKSCYSLQYLFKLLLEELWELDVKESVEKSSNSLFIGISTHNQIEARCTNRSINYQDIKQLHPFFGSN